MFYTIFSILILPITVKILDLGEDSISSPAEAAEIRASFGQEVSVWHKLDHPNVTKVKKKLHSHLLNIYVQNLIN